MKVKPLQATSEPLDLEGQRMDSIKDAQQHVKGGKVTLVNLVSGSRAAVAMSAVVSATSCRTGAYPRAA